MRRLLHPAIFLVLLALSLRADDKKQQQRYYLKPDQTADLTADMKMATAKQACENWALAAGLETLLERQNVLLGQSFWVMRMNGGEVCDDRLPSMGTLSQVVNKEFVLDDGRHVRLEVRFKPGPPVNVDAVIAGL